MLHSTNENEDMLQFRQVSRALGSEITKQGNSCTNEQAQLVELPRLKHVRPTGLLVHILLQLHVQGLAVHVELAKCPRLGNKWRPDE